MTTIKPFAQGKTGNYFESDDIKETFIVKSPDKFWRINFCTILNNTTYCVVLSQKTEDNHKNKNLILSKI